MGSMLPLVLLPPVEYGVSFYWPYMMNSDFLEVLIMTAGRQLRTLWIVGVLMAAIPAGTALAAEDANDFKNDRDKISYIVGAQFARQLMSQGIDLNVDMLVRGVREALAGQTPPFSQQEQQKLMAAFQQKLVAELRARQQQRETQAMQKLGEENEWKLKLTKPELRQFDATKDYFWILETNKGTMKIKLMPDIAPMHVTSTMFLTEKGFYNDTTFHRVIPGFVAQGGDPLGMGMGGPGYKYDGEFSPKVRHDRPFLVSMANSGPGTDGSQFFITYRPLPHLDDKHTIFGEVVEGQDVSKKLEAAGTKEGKPTEELKIVKASIDIQPKN